MGVENFFLNTEKQLTSSLCKIVGGVMIFSFEENDFIIKVHKRLNRTVTFDSVTIFFLKKFLQ